MAMKTFSANLLPKLALLPSQKVVLQRYKVFFYFCVTVETLDTIRFNVDDIRVCKILGSTMENSRIIPGMVFKRFVDSEVKNVKNAKIAVSNTHPRFHEVQT